MTDRPTDDRLSDDFESRHDFDRATVEAVGKLSEALETLEVARGHLYAFHRMSGTVDFQLGEAVDELREAGHGDLADEIDRILVGRNILHGRWSFQIVEEYDDGYYRLFREFEERSRELTGGHRHLYEAGLKRERRTDGLPGHEPDPAAENTADQDG